MVLHITPAALLHVILQIFQKLKNAIVFPGAPFYQLQKESANPEHSAVITLA